MGPRKAVIRPLVVIVDDDPEILRSLGRLLRREAYELLSTDSPRQVLEWAHHRPVDLVITDQRMPEMSGTDLLGKLRQQSPRTLGIILSGYPDAAVIVERAGLRIECLIAKPWEDGTLRDTIRNVLDDHTRRAGTTEPAHENILELRIDCAGRPAGLVLADIITTCRRAPPDVTRVLIVLENVMLLQDSLSRLIKDLARVVVWLRVPIELRDSSGCVNTFLNALGERAPVPY
jgi:DNA-binding NtrC family response regulator